MKNLNRKIKLLLLPLLSTLFLYSYSVSGQTLEDITGNVTQYFVSIPGIACKTRTNNEASVRNLGHGVFNRDSEGLVALNCGFAMPGPWTLGSGSFANNARVFGDINFNFVKTAGVTSESANESFCTVTLSDDDSIEPNGNAEFVLGTVNPTFSVSAGEVENDEVSVSTNVPFPAGNQFWFASAFCQLAQGVRLQVINLSPFGVRDSDN